MVRALWHGLRRFIILLLVATAFAILAAQYFLFHLADYRTQIESALSQSTGSPVSLGHLTGRWRGFGPELEFHDIRLLDESGGTRLHLTKVRIYLHFIDSIIARKIMPREIILHDLILLVKRKTDHSFVVAGLEGNEGNPSDAGISLFAMPFHVQVINAEVRFEDEAGIFSNKRFPGINLKINTTTEHVQVTAQLSPDLGNLQITANLIGDLTLSGGWSGVTYLKGKRVDLALLLKGLLPKGMQIQHGRADLETWLHWENGRVIDARGTLVLHDTGILSNQMPFSLDLLSAKFGWLRKQANWQLDLEELQFVRNGTFMADLQDVSIAYQEDPSGYQLSGYFNKLEIEDLAQLLPLLPFKPTDPSIPNSTHTQRLDSIRLLSPQGQLEDLKLTFRHTNDQDSWNLSGKIQHFRNAKHGKIPALTNISGSFHASNQGGSLHLDSSEVELGFTKLFREKITLDQFSGEINWSLPADGPIILTGNHLIANNKDFSTLTRFHLKLPADGSSPWLDLQSEFKNVDGSQIPHYVPMGIMEPDTVAWLDQAIISGRIPKGVCLLRGPLEDFPFDVKHTGRFEALLEVENVTVNYLSDWPKLYQIDAIVHFINNSLNITSTKGLIFDSNILQGEVVIDSLQPFSAIKLHGKTIGPLNNGLRLFRETPLRDTFSRAFKNISVQGRAEVQLHLVVPPDLLNYELDGSIRFLESTAFLKDWDLQLDNIHGILKFDLEGIYADNITTHILGNSFQVSTSPSKSHSGYTQIEAEGSIDTESFFQHFPKLTTSHLQGSSIWQLELQLPPLNASPETPVFIQAESNLAGLEILLPAPIGKDSALEVPFHLNTQFILSKAERLHIQYGEMADLLLDLEYTVDENDELWIKPIAGEIALGEAILTHQPLSETGFKVSVTLDELDLSPWLVLFENGTMEGASGQQHLNAHIDHLKLSDSQLDFMSLTINSDDNWWRGIIHSQQISGTFSFPRKHITEPAEAQLDFIKLTLQTNDDQQHPVNKKPSKGPDPRTLPSIRISVEELFINEGSFGPLKISARPVPQGLSFTIDIGTESHKLTGTGAWLKTYEQLETTTLDLLLKSESLGDLLTKLDLVENLSQAPAILSSEFSWPGNPANASISNLEGHMTLAVRQGNVPKLDPGLGRLFGLLNVSALQRRLSLDFSDLFDEGFSFDKIEGDIQFTQGKALTDNLVIDGPAARIKITGAADLTKATLDHRVLVSGKLSSTLPLAGTLTGGPAVGAVLLIAQQLVGDQVDQISAIKYLITGSWDEPKIVKDTLSDENSEDSEAADELDNP